MPMRRRLSVTGGLLGGLLLLAGCAGCGGGGAPDAGTAAAAAAAPQVTVVWPEDGTVAVPREVRVRVTFDRDMDTGTLAGAVKLRISDGRGGEVAVVPANAGYDAGLRSLFMQVTLRPGAEAELTIGPQACALDGEPLREPVVSRFLVEVDPREWWGWHCSPAALGRGRDGYLQFRDRPVPPFAGTLATPAGVFSYLIRRADDDDSGWMRMDEPPRPGSGSGSRVSAVELAAGQYPATVPGRRPGTPLTWVHLADNRGGIWVDPEKIFAAR